LPNITENKCDAVPIMVKVNPTADEIQTVKYSKRVGRLLSG
jgi:hypothetical protein